MRPGLQEKETPKGLRRDRADLRSAKPQRCSEMMLSYDAAPKASASNYQLLDTARALLNSLHQQEGIVLLYEFQERSPIPIPALFNALDEARFFASLAGPKELEAYCWACFDAMKPKRQQDFIRYVMKGEQE